MTDLPVLFSGPMIRSLNEGRKTQTRRLLGKLKGFGKVTEFGRSETHGYDWTFRDRRKRWNDITNSRLVEVLPYAVGDRLWVRETWTASGTGVWTISDARRRIARDQRIIYAANGDEGPWWPSIHMPREFSRLTLIVESVRVECLQDISEEDAEAEGVKPHLGGYFPYGISTFMTVVVDGEEVPAQRCPTARLSYEMLWGSLHGRGAWAANPWVSAIGFRVIKANIDSSEAK